MIVVTGASGLVGGNLVPALRGAQIVWHLAYTRLISGKIDHDTLSQIWRDNEDQARNRKELAAALHRYTPRRFWQTHPAGQLRRLPAHVRGLVQHAHPRAAQAHAQCHRRGHHADQLWHGQRQRRHGHGLAQRHQTEGRPLPRKVRRPQEEK